MARKENKEIDKAIDIINQMSMDEKEWNLYISRQRAIWDYNTGMKTAKEKGIEEGAKLEKLEIAKYNIPIDVDTIEKGYPILCA